MKVAMLTHAYLPHVGGAELQIASLAPLLRSRGIDIHIITRGFRGLPSFEIIGDVPVHRLPVYGPKGMASITYTLSAIPVIAKLRPDLIHSYALLSPTTTAIIAGRLLHIPVVAKVLRGGPMGDLDVLKHKTLGKRRIGMFQRNVRAFISISSEIDRELIEIGVPESRRPFIPNGVDTERFAPVPLQEKQSIRKILNLPEGPIVVFTGRLAVEKRVHQLLEIWPEVRSRYPDALLLILGDGEERSNLERNCPQGVQMPGRCEDVAPYLQASDLFVLPSATEGLSNALLEALSCELPAIVTEVGGAGDVITHGLNGWLIPPDQPRLLRDALLLLVGDASYLRTMGRNARQKILQSYSLPVTADRLTALYHSVSQSPRSDLSPKASVA